jgi:acyl-CoA oxidase
MFKKGCFALSELAHGSNFREIQTLATYSQETDEFIINTSNEHAVKFWVGSSSQIAINAIVFAKLIISDVSYGIHAFIVPLRKKISHSLMEGIYSGDCGKKIGINNKDEGFLIFRNARIPRENLLDRYCKVNNKGEYKSLLKTQNDRFGFMMGAIMNEARIYTANRYLLNLMKGLLITTRFVCTRRQFHKDKENKKLMSPETAIIEYELTQYRLMPFLAGTIILKIAMRKLHDKFEENRNLLLDFNNPKMLELHALICSMKAICTWYSKNGLSSFRELCGGLGYSSYNRIGEIYNDNNINVIWQGDNYVLLQQTARYILDYYNDLKTKNYKPEEFELLSFLKKEDFNSTRPIYFIQEKKDFLNPKFLMRIFENRFIYVLESSVKEFNKNIEKTRDIFTAWNLSQVNHLKEIAIMFGELFIIRENFIEINNILLDKDSSKIIKKLFTLWALNLIYEKIELNFHFFNQTQIKDLKDLIVELCFELKDKCISIVETFNFPDEILNSPIGVKSGDIYREFLKKIKLVNSRL